MVVVVAAERDDGVGRLREGGMGGAGTSKRKSRDSGPGRLRVPKLRDEEAAPAPADLDALLVAHCRIAVTELPAGRPGARWAADFLEVLPEACRRRLPDVVATGPKLFEFLVGQGLFVAMPSPRIVPLVLGLVASASPLLQARSSRQWVLWLARVHEPGSREDLPFLHFALALAIGDFGEVYAGGFGANGYPAVAFIAG